MLILTACGGDSIKEEANSSEADSFKIGIIQLMNHPSLDQAREGFVEELDDLNLSVAIDYKNAQGDIANVKTIVDKFVSDKVDLIYAIATPAAEAAMGATSEIPILFSAVTDPVESKLVESIQSPGRNVTGSSDMVDLKAQMSLFKEIDPSIERIGIIYSADESNSLQQVEAVKNIVDEMDMNLETISIQNMADIPQAATSLARNIQGLYMVSDNKVSSSTTLVADIMKEHKIPVVAAVEADVEQGALITMGINYKSLGKVTGQQAKEILVDKKAPADIAVYVAKEFDKKANKETLDILGLDSTLKAFEGAEFKE